MSGGVPRVTFDGGGQGVYISYIHLLPDFIHGNHTSCICIYYQKFEFPTFCTYTYSMVFYIGYTSRLCTYCLTYDTWGYHQYRIP